MIHGVIADDSILIRRLIFPSPPSCHALPAVLSCLSLRFGWILCGYGWILPAFLYICIRHRETEFPSSYIIIYKI